MGKPFISSLSFEQARKLISILLNFEKRPYNNIPLRRLELELVALLEKYCKNYDEITSEEYKRLIYLIELIFGSGGGNSGYKETVLNFPVGYEDEVEIYISDDEEERIKKKKQIMEARDFNERLRDRLTEWIFGNLRIFRSNEIRMARWRKERLEAKKNSNKNDGNGNGNGGSGIAD